MVQLTRRKLLQQGTAVAGVASACATAASCLPADDEGSGDTGEDEPDWKALKAALPGRVVTSIPPVYVALALPNNWAYSHIRPEGIVQCASVADVVTAIQWAGTQGLPVVPRSAYGHSYAGLSATRGLSLDLSAMKSVQWQPGSGTVEIGAGALSGAVADSLWRDGLMIPLGTCETVGIAGLALAGGIGFDTRRFGLTCDALVRAEMVTAAGDIVVAGQGPGEAADLLWALRGAGTSGLGVCSSLTFNVHDVGREPYAVARVHLRGAESMAAAFATMAGLSASAPPEFSATMTLVAQRDLEPELQIDARLQGTPEQLRDLLAELPPRASARDEIVVATDHRGAARFFNLRGTSRAFASASAVYDQWPPETVIAELLQWAGQLPSAALEGRTRFILGGAALASIDAATAAFPHRSARLFREGSVSWAPGSFPIDERSARAWLRDGFELASAWATGGALMNFTDRELSEGSWQGAYHGANYPALSQLKAALDPTNLFRTQQSIEPAPAP